MPDFESCRTDLEDEITELSKNGLSWIELFSLRLELSRCIMKTDFDRLREKIKRRKDELWVLLSSGLFT